MYISWETVTFVLLCCRLGVLRSSTLNELERKSPVVIHHPRVKGFLWHYEVNSRMQPQLYLWSFNTKNNVLHQRSLLSHRKKEIAFWFYEIIKYYSCWWRNRDINRFSSVCFWYSIYTQIMFLWELLGRWAVVILYVWPSPHTVLRKLVFYCSNILGK